MKTPNTIFTAKNAFNLLDVIKSKTLFVEMQNVIRLQFKFLLSNE